MNPINLVQNYVTASCDTAGKVGNVPVDAINELYQNDSNSLADLGSQLYVDGENNIILGQNNTVYGNNNLIIGSNNVVVGDNINLIQSDKNIYTSSYYNTDYYDVDSSKIYVYSYDGESVSFPFHVGDTVIVSVYISWATLYLTIQRSILIFNVHVSIKYAR